MKVEGASKMNAKNTDAVKVKRVNLSRVFTIPDVLEVPFFQRAYVWGEDQLERLLEDVENTCSTKRHYFFGVLIFKRDYDADFPDGNVNIVIDGQQRLTALSILCKVLCLRNREMRKFDRKFRLRDGSIALRHGDNDREIYEKIMNLKELKEINSENKVAKTYNYFRTHIDPEKLDFNRICTLLNFAFVDVGKEENEQEIFDTINSVGVELTVSELLKNYFFCRGETNREDYEKYWKPVFEKDDATRSYWNRRLTNISNYDEHANICSFFFSYLQIKVREQGPGAAIPQNEFIRYLKIKDKELFDSYRRFIKRYMKRDRSHILPILEEIAEYSRLFRNAIDVKKLDSPLPERGIERINAIIFELHIFTVIPYILFVERNVENEEERNAIYDCLEAYIVRRSIAGYNNLGYDHSYNGLFGGILIWKHILSAKSLQDHIKNSEGKSCMPTDEEVRNGFRKSYIINFYQKVILYLIESKIRNQKYCSTQLLPIKKYTIEHIMPIKWMKYWPTDDPEKRDEKLYTYGNFALVTKGLNSRVANRPWNEKRVELREHAKDIKTLLGALEKEQWDEDAIDERTEKLADIAIKIWPGI